MRASQIEKLKRLKAERDPAMCQAMLERLSAVAKTGEGNLLAAAVDAARAKATVGEISSALEKSVEPACGANTGDEGHLRCLVARLAEN